MRHLALLVLLAVSCGRSSALDDDMVPMTPMTQPPVDAPACRSTCRLPPRGTETPFQTTSGGVPLHWLPCAGCVRITIDNDLPVTSVAEVALVVKNWSAALHGQGPNEGLCLRIDERRTTPDPMEPRRIHLRPLTNASSNTMQRTESRYNSATGELLSVEVLVRSLDPQFELTYGLGQALGLASSQDRTRSVMIPSGGGLRAPGPADAASLKAMYGPPPACSP